MRQDDVLSGQVDGQVERLPVVRPWPRPASYAPILPRAVRGQPALPSERRSRPRVGDAARGRLVDLIG